VAARQDWKAAASRRGYPTAVAFLVGLHGTQLTIDSGWREVADPALAFVKRFV
jgi:hypothetical protein